MSEQRPTSRARRRLAPSEKYEIYVQVLTQQTTQREAAERWGVDRSTVVHVCRTAKQGALDALAASVPGRPWGQRGGGGADRGEGRDRAASGYRHRAGRVVTLGLVDTEEKFRSVIGRAPRYTPGRQPEPITEAG